MLKLLVKKQLMEVFKGYFVNSKTNQKRTTISTVLYFLFFAAIMFGVLGSSFMILAYAICEPLVEVKMEWLYFLLMSLITIVVGVFAGSFSSYALLYLGKDNDLLLSLPIPSRTTVASRLIAVYILCLMYSAVPYLPIVIVYQRVVGFNGISLVFELLQLLLISLIVLTLTCLVALGVAKVSQKTKNKSYVRVIFSLAFMAAYYYFYAKVNNLIQTLVLNAIEYGTKVQDAAYVLYSFGSVALGDLKSIFISLGITIAILIIVYIILAKTFYSFVTFNTGETKKKYKNVSKTKSVFAALFSKELALFTSSSSYMLNKGLGIVLLPCCGIALLFKGPELIAQLTEALGSNNDFILVGLIAGIIMMSSMNDICSPSFSLEGKNLWILKTLPVSFKDILKAKLNLQLRLAYIPLIIFELCAVYVFKIEGLYKIIVVLFPLLVATTLAIFALCSGLKFARLNWTNEIQVIKNSLASTCGTFSGFIYGATYILIYYFFGSTLGFVYYTCIWTIITLIIMIVLLTWLNKKGEQVFKAL